VILITSITHLVLHKINSNYHHKQAQGWSIAVSTRCFHFFQFWVYFQAELRPRLRSWRSASRVHSQVWRGRPGGRLQSNYGATKTPSLTYLKQESHLLERDRQTDRDRYENSDANLYAYGQKFYYKASNSWLDLKWPLNVG